MADGVVLSVAEVEAFLDEVFPQRDGALRLIGLSPMAAAMRLEVEDRHLRPGGTVSGPSMFTLADCAFYAAVLGMIGREPLTVTTTLTINFLRKPGTGPIRADARILKLGRLLATGDVILTQEERAVAHATTTYAIPQRPPEK